MIHIIKNIKRPNTNLVKKLLNQSSATVHEVMGKRGAMHSSIKPLFNEIHMCGPAITVKSQAGDNLMLLKALDMAKSGDVIVADMGQLTEAGSWGEITSLQAKKRGINGFVTNSSVRDSGKIRELKFPVFCKGVSIKGTVKESLGYINYPISCGDIVVNPGDIILGDDDGIVVIPLEEAEEILKNANKREQKEKNIIERIQKGESLFGILGYQEKLRKGGCIEE